jgi:hypothetical protein
MSATKKTNPAHPRMKRPRAAHSEYLKRFHGEAAAQTETPALPAAVSAPEPAPAGLSESVAEVESSLQVLTRTRTSLVVLQTLVQRLGQGRPLMVVKLKLSTALRGARKVDGLSEAAYLFRLEVVKTSGAVKLEGFNLGPWRAEGLDLEGENIFVAEPLWTGFQSQTGKLKGRIRFADTLRQVVLDVPWATEAIVPGPEPL